MEKTSYPDINNEAKVSNQDIEETSTKDKGSKDKEMNFDQLFKRHHLQDVQSPFSSLQTREQRYQEIV